MNSKSAVGTMIIVYAEAPRRVRRAASDDLNATVKVKSHVAISDCELVSNGAFSLSLI